MTDQPARTFSTDFKRFFIRGLAILLPSVLTLWILVQAYRFVDKSIAAPINTGLQTLIINTARVWTPLQDLTDPTTEQVEKEIADLRTKGVKEPNRESIRDRLRGANIQRWWEDRWYMNLVGLVVAIVAVYIAGRLLGGFVGRRIHSRLEQLINSVPIVRQVYPYVKRVVDFLFSDEKNIKFNRVVVVEYPRKGVWSVGFMTGTTMKAIQAESGEDSVTVFIPSSPTPFTGYTITVPRRNVIELPISVEEAIMFTVSGGVLVPPDQLIDGTESNVESGGAVSSLPQAGGQGRRSARAGPDASGARAPAPPGHRTND